jgi:polysaccharide biosynthesis/export protein
MHLVRRLFRPLAAVSFAILGSWLLAATAHAQTTSLSNEGLSQLFQGLSPAEQQQLQGTFGGQGMFGTGSTVTGQAGLQNQAQLQQLQEQNAVRQRRMQEEEQPIIPLLKGGDWVIVEIGFALAPRATSPQSSALQQAAAAQQSGTLSAQQIQQLKNLQASGGSAALASLAQGVTPGAALGTADQQRLAAVVSMIHNHNPYQLSANGELTLPGFPPVPLLGLTEDQATLRVSVVPAFQGLQVRVTLLPLNKTGEAALKPFGYDLFAEYPASFAPLTNVPVPSNYIVGPGDVLDVQLYGNQNHEYQMTVGRDGRVDFPQLGPIDVGGQLFSSVEKQVDARVAHQMIGVRASISMAETRSIQIFVAGDAFDPGSYTISGLGTVTSALYAAGGLRKTGSMRRIELKRGGVVVNTLDLYDLLLRGSTADDAKLLQGDVVFVPPVGQTVAIDGQVERPAIYEIRNENSPAQVVEFAGGLMPNADTSKATVTRIMPDGERVVLPLDLTAAGGVAQGLRNGDYIHIPRLRPALDAAVMLAGNVYTAGDYEYHPGMRLTDVIRSVDELKPNSDLHYLLIRRELQPDRRIEALSADLAVALAHPGTSADPILMPRDRITVFDLSLSRDHIIEPIMNELRMESTGAQPEQIVSVGGTVNVPGEYPLEPGMKVADLIRAGGGLANAAYSGKGELTRYVVDADGTRHTEIIDVDLARALSGDPAANLTLQPYDSLGVKQISQWTSRETIQLQGEVRFPGTYSITPGETLKSVLQRAGGLTPYAFPRGAVFTRTNLKEREQQQMDQLAARMKIELGVLALRGLATGTGGGGGSGGGSGGGDNVTNAMVLVKTLLGELEAESAVGRLVINLQQIQREPANSQYDVVLRNGDELIVPKFEQEVSVLGEVQDPTSHLYDPDLSRDAYIGMSGGFTAEADKKRVYVVRADGSVIAKQGSRWFDGGSNIEMEPGDTIVVPINATQVLPLPFWQDVTGIVYNVAIAVAAIHGL